MIEIKTIGGTVLYVSKETKTVKGALEEAVARGANLRGANLDGANLRGANLDGAYLDGANLRGANLDGANLDGANLRGANLGGANLRGANLRGANLRGANLRGAYLDGAYLRGAYLDGAYLDGAYLRGANLDGAYLDGAYLDGAYLDGAVWKDVATLLRTAITSMNDSGRHWIQGTEQKKLEDGSTAYCSIGSVNAQTEAASTTRTISIWLLNSVAAGSIVSFNDDKDTTWEDVQAVFAVAIKNAERFAAGSSAA